MKKLDSHSYIKLASLLDDPFLGPYRPILERRHQQYLAVRRRLTGSDTASLADSAGCEHEFFGLHRLDDESWIFREWAPAARKIFLVGDFSGFREDQRFALQKSTDQDGVWFLTMPPPVIAHGMHYCLHIYFADGTMGKRLPSYARYVVQDPNTNIFTSQVYAPKQQYVFKHPSPPRQVGTLIYESHIGMAQCDGKVGSFREFADNVLPRIADANYNTIQLMAIMSHPYYGSFGYHVANFFSIASRFGTPDEFKMLIDRAHELKLRVIMDVVHSHAVRNEVEGLARFDGTREQYFHAGSRGEHAAWDSLCFNYGKNEVLKFLLSNLKFYLEEYNLDGFRFDGVTSMLYHHHGLNKVFQGYHDYFSDDVDEDAYTFLALANELVHEVRPDALTIAEDVSGMPGLAAPQAVGGAGFDMRMAMGVTDLWFKLFDQSDENWDLDNLFYELTNHRMDEHCISYVECHDQAIVGGQTAIFRLAGCDMYTKMRTFDTSESVIRAVALHKMIRLATASTGEAGYLNFMGNEFGHPEWIDFPREGNNWSYNYARRQWNLADDPELFYSALGKFDRAMLQILKEYEIWKFNIRKLKICNQDKIMAFERGNLWIFFNFHSHQSYTNYGVEVLPGKYQLLLNSDKSSFGGFNRLAPEQCYLTVPEQKNNILKHEIKLYLPSRTALIIAKID